MQTPDDDKSEPVSPEEAPLVQETAIDTSTGYSQDVLIIELDGRRIVLVGTAHISQSSVDLVREVLEKEMPDRVCVELDERRFETLESRDQWQALDLKEIIRRKQLTTLLVNLLLSAYQKRLGAELGVAPGSELLEATQVAKKLDIPVELVDRDVRITLRRATAATPLLRRLWLLSEMLVSMFDRTEITEEQLKELREQDVLTELMQELGRQHPALKRVLIDERDVYLGQKIRQAEGQNIVAVVGAGHVQGIRRILQENVQADLTELEVIPPVKSIWKVLGWGIPLMILSAITWIGMKQGADAALDNIVFWILANSIPATIGALLARAHPMTILAAFVSAPVCSLTPVVGTAYVTAFVQAYYEPPKVKEFESVADDLGVFKRWWQNRLLRIFLAYILPGLGSMLGSAVGIFEIGSNLAGAAPELDTGAALDSSAAPGGE